MDRAASTGLLCCAHFLGGCTASHPVALTPSPPPRTSEQAAAPQWRFEIEPYVWLPSTSGTGTTNTTPPLEIDLVGTLDAAFPLAIGARSPDGKFTAIADGFYARLKDDEGTLQTTTEATMIECGAGFAIDANQRVTALIGLRYVDIDYDVSLGTSAGNAGADWIDPWIGVRAVLPLSDTFAIRLRSDVGGFGVGTDFTWQAIAVLAASLGTAVTIDVGYRGIGLDYDDSGLSYDVTFHGPVFGLAVSF